MSNTRTYTYEQYDAIVAHNLTLREQLNRATKDLTHAHRQMQKQSGMINALVKLLSQVGWKVGATGDASRLMLDTRIHKDRPNRAFLTISATNTGRRWNVHARESGEEYAVAQADFDYYGPDEVAVMQEL